ncbi:hypothetical protein TNCV_3615241 [Trichonephila clavipes]|nr:hypothetical protein TNCV_3615241 [Trichonephila clavipes]
MIKWLYYLNFPPRQLASGLESPIREFRPRVRDHNHEAALATIYQVSQKQRPNSAELDSPWEVHKSVQRTTCTIRSLREKYGK